MDDREFKNFVKSSLDLLEPRAIAAEFDIGYPTVLRWASGVARPHPKIREIIVKKITEMLEQKRK
jgi:hypothetical protein